MLLIFLSFFLLSTFVAAMGSVCPSDGSMSSLTAGCISSTFLHIDSDRQVKVGLLFLKANVPFFQKGIKYYLVCRLAGKVELPPVWLHAWRSTQGRAAWAWLSGRSIEGIIY